MPGADEAAAGNGLAQMYSADVCKCVPMPPPAGKARLRQKCQYCSKLTQWWCRKCEVYCCRDGQGNPPRYCFAAHRGGEQEASKQRKRIMAAQGGRDNPRPARLSMRGGGSGA